MRDVAFVCVKLCFVLSVKCDVCCIKSLTAYITEPILDRKCFRDN